MQADFIKPDFSLKFLDDHAGAIITQPKTAIIEIVANSYDAGATAVQIEWPEEKNGLFSISDNGIGLTEEEFSKIWMQLSFSRKEVFGTEARLPNSAKKLITKRSAFGKNGKGRHAPFCFAENFLLNSKPQTGETFARNVSRSNSIESPFLSRPEKFKAFGSEHGIKISGKIEKNFIPASELEELIGSKFLVDPSFKIAVNGKMISLMDLDGLVTDTITVQGHAVKIHSFQSQNPDQKIRFKGIAWWVNNRLVSEPSWNHIVTKKPYIDGRYDTAKKIAFVVQCEHLSDYVLADWSGLIRSDLTDKTVDAVDKFVKEKLLDLSKGERQAKREKAIDENVDQIRDLTPSSRQNVVQFLDDAIQNCKKLTDDDLVSLVTVVTKLEKTKSGFNIMQELAKCSPEDLEKWNEVITKWSASTAHLVLDEIHKRIVLVEKLGELIQNPNTKELQELQPVFDNGLWIFGPEYEGIMDFHSNKTLKTIIEKSFGGKKTKIENPKKRPDFVVSVYSSDKINYDTGLVTEIGKILIIELKKTGVPIRDEEINQGKKYAKALKESGQKIDDKTPIEVFVLGTDLNKMARYEEISDLSIRVFPCTYEGIIRQANARLFYLKKKIEKLNIVIQQEDPMISKALAKGYQEDLI